MALTKCTPGSIFGRAQREKSGDGITAEVLADRRRIADDLYTGVIHQLFSLGLEATSLRCRVSDDRLGRRLDDLVAGLDQTITDLRRSIFELHPVEGPPERPTPVEGGEVPVSTASPHGPSRGTSARPSTSDGPRREPAIDD